MSETFLLDSNVCIRLMNRTSPALAQRLKQTPRSKVRLCSVVKFELWFGVFNSANPAENQRRLLRFFSPFKSLPYDDECAQHAGLVRSELRRLGTEIGGSDLLIAATALAFDVTLVTRNVREFSRVRGLRIEDWEIVTS